MERGSRGARRQRHVDVEVPPEEWTQERIGSLLGRELSQVRVSSVSLVLDFWEPDDDISVWLYADEIRFAGAGAELVAPLGRRVSGEAVSRLCALLGRQVTTATVAMGILRLVFAEGTEVCVPPSPTQQAWALTFEQSGSVTCGAGGSLDVQAL